MRVSATAFALLAQSVACFSSVLEKWGFPIWSKGRKRCGKCCCVKSRLCEFIYFGAEVVIIITLVIYLQYFQISAHFPFPVANRIRFKNRVKCLSMFYCMLLLFICKLQQDYILFMSIAIVGTDSYSIFDSQALHCFKLYCYCHSWFKPSQHIWRWNKR